MGTNYYLHSDVCPHCNRSDPPRHIGKSSAGWCFSLHVYPDEGIGDLPDWLPLLTKGEIRDEYGATIPVNSMMAIIQQRAWELRSKHLDDQLFLDQNHAEPGPNNLLRCKVDGVHCVKQGSSTYDCIVGDFS